MWLFFFALIATSSFVRTASGAIVEYSSGHADIGLAYEGNGNLFLHYHFGTSAFLDGVSGIDIEYAPDQAYVRVGDANRTLNATVAPLGVVNGPVWRLPDTDFFGRPSLGIATAELEDAIVNPAVFTSAGMRLTNFSGPGAFALYGFDLDGNLITHFQSNNGIDPMVDFVNLNINSHSHFIWGFSEAGLYELTIEGFANGTDEFGAPLENITDTGTFLFAVGDATAVPEPSSMALLSVFGAGLYVWRRRANQIQD